MAFKLNTPPYNNDNTPIYSVNLGGDILGKANNNGSILVDINVKPKDKEKVIDHEMVHIDQFKRGDLDYDNKNVYWKNKTYPRSKMQEGAKNLPWEKEAYNKTKK